MKKLQSLKLKIISFLRNKLLNTNQFKKTSSLLHFNKIQNFWQKYLTVKMSNDEYIM